MNFLAIALIPFVLMLVQRKYSSRNELNVIAIKSILTDPALQNAMFQHPVADGPTLYGLLDSSTFDQLMDLANRADGYGRPDVALGVVELAKEKMLKDFQAFLQKAEAAHRLEAHP